MTTDLLSGQNEEPRAHLMRWGLPTDRIETLADGIFAIVMTLLVLELAVPAHAEHHLRHELWQLAPKIASYVYTFLVLGVFWVAHHLQVFNIKTIDRGFMWITIVLLLFVGFVPFSTALIGEYPLETTSQVVYGLNMISIGLMLAASLRYSLSHELTRDDLDPLIPRSGYRRSLFAPVAYAIGIGLSFVDPRITLAIYAVVAIVYLAPPRFDIFFHLQDRDRRRLAK
jgi:uncharacterized membrane protein